MNTKQFLRRWACFSAAVSLVFGVGLPARSALANRKLSIKPVSARAVIVPTSVTTVSCRNADGEEFTLTRLSGQGPITSEDPRLEGTFFADAKLLHNAVGVGVSHDDFEVRDPLTGMLKWRGSADALDAGAEPVKGMAIAELGAGTSIWAESTVFLPAPGSQDPVIIEYGGEGPGIPQDRALAISGDCRRFF